MSLLIAPLWNLQGTSGRVCYNGVGCTQANGWSMRALTSAQSPKTVQNPDHATRTEVPNRAVVRVATCIWNRPHVNYMTCM